MNDLAAQLILEQADSLTESVVEQDYARRPELERRYGARGREYYARDNRFHLSFLAEAVASGESSLFVDYVSWARSMLVAHGVAAEDLSANLLLLCDVLEEHLPPEAGVVAADVVRLALAQLPATPETPPTFIDPDHPQGGLAGDYLRLLLAGDRRGAAELVAEAITNGLSMRDLYLEVFQRSQREIGRLWQLNRISVAEEHFCTAATQTIMNQSCRLMLETPRNGRRVTALCVADDLHEMGLRIVADFFELAGWDCDYLGANMPTLPLLKQLARRPPDLVAIAATMSYHVRAVAEVIEGMRARPELAGIPVLVGGRPFLVSDGLWRSVGADGCAPDAEGAVALGLELVERRHGRE